MQPTKRVAAILAAGLMLMGLGTVAATAQPGDHKTTICHRTGVNSMNNKFVKISVDDHALPAHIGDERGHDGDMLPDSNGNCPGDVAPPMPPDGKDAVVCHRTDDDEPFQKIVVEEGPELDAHLDHGDQLPDPDTGQCPPVEDDGDDDGAGCSNTGNVGINLGVCRLAAPISLINILGSNEQEAVVGGDGDCTNEDNVGINALLCDIVAPISGINILGSNLQSAIVP